MIDEKNLREMYGEVAGELRAQIKAKDRILNQYKREHGVLEVFFADLKASITPIDPVQPYLPNFKIGKTENVACFHITDGHMGAVQFPDEIEGFNEYNIEICQMRQLGFIHRGIDAVSRMRLAYKIKDCAVLVTGDMISGDIHDELRITNEVPSPVQVSLAGDLLAEQLMLLAGHFEKVTVHFLVEDNHSRLTKKPQAKEAGLNSLNYLVGFIAKARTENQPNIEFNIYPQYEKVVVVNGRRYLITHGHGILAWAGVPYYGIERKIAKESTARMAIMLDEAINQKKHEVGFHKLVMGHLHIDMTHPNYIITGSPQGTDAYDHKNGRHGDPSQSMWFVHPVHGEFGRVPFNLKYV